MAKITKKIRISEYDIVNNQFNLTFQLSGYTDQLSFEALVADNSVLYIDGDSDDNLVNLGFSNGDISQMISELVQWLEKPRKQLNDNSHMYTMRSRFEVAERLEAERRGKAAVERIQAEAPPLDWAMSVLYELVDEPVEKPLIDIGTIFNHPSVLNTLDQIANGARMARSPESNASALEELNDTLNAAQHSVQAISDRIAAMETAGLGEEPAKVMNPPDPLDAILPRLVDEVRHITGMPFIGYEHEKQRLSDAFRETLQGAFDISHTDRAQQSRAEDEARYQYRRKIADERTEKAVNTIHTQARRFSKPLTLREHDFLRAIIQEEIEKVVGGVL